MFLIGAGSLHVPLLGECGLELGLRLIQDDLAHEPAFELDREQANLLPICRDVFGEDLGLGVQRAKRVIEAGHVGLDREPNHLHIDRGGKGGGLRRFE